MRGRAPAAPAPLLAEDYWSRKLAGVERSQLFRDPAPGASVPASWCTAVSPALAERIERASAGNDAGIFLLLLAAFVTLLYRYTGAAEPLVASSPFGLEGGPQDRLVFFRPRLAAAHSLRSLLVSLRQELEEVYRHQDFDFEALCGRLRADGWNDERALFDAGLTFGRFNRFSPWLDELGLWLAVERKPEGWSLRVRDGRRAYDERFLAQLGRHFLRVLGWLLDHADAALGQTVLMDGVERERLLGAFAGKATLYPAGRSLAELFAEQAARTPSAPAVVCGERRLTYGEVNRQANRLAHELIGRHGIGPDDLVGVMLDRSERLIVALLAILKAGGAYAPLDPDYPDERIDGMLADLGGRLVLAEERHRGRLAARVPVAGVETPDGAPDADPPARATGRHLAYAIFTSGSTGRPKGVLVEQRSVVRLVRNTDYVELRPGVRILQTGSMSFDASTFEVWGALLNGGTLYLPAPEEVLDATALARLIARHRIDCMWLTASLFNQIVTADASVFAPLRVLLVGGERLSPPHIERVLRACPGLTVVNGYGPTENTTFTACHRIGTAAGADIPIGRPIANTRVYVLDEADELVPPGVAGELCIAGDGLARGYLRRPELTAERFVPDPFRAGERMYRSGDLVRWTSGGELEYLGRRDDQVKIRGFRIEPAEVRHRLLEHPAVRQAAVVARDLAKDRVLVAYVVGEGIEAAELRRHLSLALPEFMLPSRFVVLPELPLNLNGKVDLQALPDPDAALPGAGRTPPRNVLEQRLAAIWEETLEISGIGVEDSFFDLGGHSLQAATIVGRVRAELGLDLRLADLFEEPTVAGLATRAGVADPAAALPPIVPEARDRDLPLSFAQQRLWFMDRWEPDSPVYNLPGALRLRGDLDPAALAAALSGIAARHEALRTTFEEAAGRPRQRIHAAAEVPLPAIDLTGLPVPVRWSEAARLRAGEAARPFDLARGPLLRALLVRMERPEHELLLSLHHIAGDAWSIGILVRELGDLYAGGSTALPALPVQYADYAVWQRRCAAEGALDAQLADWCERLRDLPALQLPADRPQPAVRTPRGATLGFDLPADLTGGLAAWTGSAEATPFMGLLAAFSLLLSRHAGQLDVAVGSPVAGRGRPEVAGLIGCFVNTLVLRLDLAGDPSAAELLARVREVVLAALTRQDVPFEMLVERLDPERDPDRTPLFQVLFAMAELRLEALSLPGLVAEPLPVDNRTAKFDLTLAIEDTGMGLRAGLEYDRDLFEAVTAERLRRGFETLLAGMVEEPRRRLSELPLLGAAERHQLLVEWNDTGEPRPGRGCLHELFAAQAARRPGAVAIVRAGEALTYAELDRRASRLAAHLRARGVGPEVRVAICAERSLDLAVGLLAILKAGGAYVPLDPAYPRERLDFILRDSGAALLLTQADLAPGEEPSTVFAGPAAEPENLAYLIYTSGSTGRPKAVAIEHRSATALLAWAAGVYGPADLAGVLASTSICFDLSVFELFLPWSRGGTVVLAQDALELPDCDGVTLVNTVPSALAALLDQGGLPASVRTVNLAGEPLAPALVDAIYGRGRPRDYSRGVARVFDLYGPSEATTYSTCALRRPGGRASIGRPVAGTRAYVLSRDLQPAPAGSPGELCLAGAGLARGYLGRPDLTAAAFVPDPFGAAPGSRLYRTGDLARHLPDGDLEFLGRLDHQMKVRGFRVEPGEVEAALVSYPGVREAVVLARQDVMGGALTACVVPAALDTRELRTYLAERLPAALVPSAFVVLDELPRLPNGKLDRPALAARCADAAVSSGTEAPPRGPDEELLAALCAGVLGRERVGVHDSFFELGGHSLLAVQLLSRLREAFGVEVQLRELFASPTVAGLAAALARARQGGAADPLPLTATPRPAEIPASFGQRRLWFLHQLDPAGTAYNMPAALLLRGRLDVAALESALTEVVRRHEALRTTLALGGQGWPIQKIAPAGPVLLERAEPAQATALAASPFDLEHGPLRRFLLVRLGEDEHALLAVLHHAICDGWSLDLLLREVGALYGAFAAGAPSPLPEPALQYADWALWQQRWMEKAEPHLELWRRQLAGVEPLRLPLDRPRSRRPDPRGARWALPLDGDLVARLDRLGQGRAVTRFMVFLAVFQALLARYAGQNEVTVGAPVAHRDRLAAEGIVGFCADALALRTRIDDQWTAADLLAAVRETVLAAHAHREVPFERLVEELQPERDTALTPLFQVLFSLRPAVLAGVSMGDLAVEPLEVALPGAQFDLMLAIEEGSGAPAPVIAAFEYRPVLFDASTIVRLGGHFANLLAAVADAPDRRLDDLSWLDAAERHQLLAEWNDTAAFRPHGPLHWCVAGQAARTPDAVAVVLDGQQITYDELDRRANRLAHHLLDPLEPLENGAGPGAIVGVCLERSLEAVIAILAVLKAGGVYLPLDPAYPRERLALMIADSGAAALLTRSGLAEALTAPRVICLDMDWDEIAARHSAPPIVPETEASRAYVIYTSGSTGRPKGVVVSHRAIANRLFWMLRRFRFGAAERFLQRTSLSFDASIWELFVPWLCGARLVLARPAERLDAADLVRTIVEEQVTVAQFVPSLLRALLPELAPCASLRRVFCGGEELGRDLQGAFFATFAGTELHQLYGPTETAIDATWWECRPSAGPGAVPIGRPLDNLQVHLLDAGMRPLPAGVPGELYIG
ncbi:MAG TPA: amino acid adenylation domain-containing protein, partial [Thermoanaerobaculia bacterium]|nr:amino acid adenylation domain-containing protein [Thermoanaerobaculia bacterium]